MHTTEYKRCQLHQSKASRESVANLESAETEDYAEYEMLVPASERQCHNESCRAVEPCSKISDQSESVNCCVEFVVVLGLVACVLLNLLIVAMVSYNFVEYGTEVLGQSYMMSILIGMGLSMLIVLEIFVYGILVYAAYHTYKTTKVIVMTAFFGLIPTFAVVCITLVAAVQMAELL